MCSSRASRRASRRSVLTRSPGGRCSFDGATTSHLTPADPNARANPNPVGPASYATATGPGNCATQPSTTSLAGTSRWPNTRPVAQSTASATTDRAWTSSPTVVRSVHIRCLLPPCGTTTSADLRPQRVTRVHVPAGRRMPRPPPARSHHWRHPIVAALRVTRTRIITRRTTPDPKARHSIRSTLNAPGPADQAETGTSDGAVAPSDENGLKPARVSPDPISPFAHPSVRVRRTCTRVTCSNAVLQGVGDKAATLDTSTDQRQSTRLDVMFLCPRQDSNLRPRLRRAVLYPLSYGGSATKELYQAGRRPCPRPTTAAAARACGPESASGS